MHNSWIEYLTKLNKVEISSFFKISCSFSGVAEFKTLISDIDNYSVDELTEKAELAFSKCVQRMGFSLSDNEEDTKVFVGRKVFPTNTTKKKGRYGSMLSSK